jgi:hypothetical protein
MPSPLLRFGNAAAELRRQEIARLFDAVVPPIKALRSMTPPEFRAVVALMLHRFGHDVITEAPDLITTKAGRKFITVCAKPADITPTGRRDLARLHDVVITTNATRGFFITR